MVITKCKGIVRHRIEFYDDIDSPMLNWIKFNKFYLASNSVGCDIASINTRIDQIQLHLNGEAINKAAIELDNLRKLISILLNESNFDLLALASMVKSIDGIQMNINTDGEIEAVAEKLKKIGISIKDMKINEAIKKKIQNQKEIYFEENGFDLEIYLAYKQLYSAELDSIIDNTEVNKGVYKDISRLTPAYIFPKKMVDIELEYENVCALMQMETNKDVKKMSIKEFDINFKLFQKRYKNTQNG